MSYSASAPNTTTTPSSFKGTPLTPPESDIRATLTPPQTEQQACHTPVRQVLEAIRDHHQGISPYSPWHQFPLREIEYSDLLLQVEKQSESLQDFWEHKLRYDYFPSTSTFVLRMPTTTHDRFLSSIVQEVFRQLQAFETADSTTSDFVKRIRPAGSSSIIFPGLYGRHDPDASFGHEKAQYPGVILEVSYSQKRRDLGRLADDYILGSDGNIRVVVGLDIEYLSRSKGNEASSKLAMLSVWRPKITTHGDEKELIAHQDVVDIVFRDENGFANPCPEAGLSLRLEDFAAKALCRASMPEKIFVPATTLTHFLAEAEGEALMRREYNGVMDALAEGVRKRRRQSTPVDEVDEVKEMKLAEDMERVEKRARKEDKDWTPS